MADMKTVFTSLRKLAGPGAVFWILPWLMVLLAAGTLAQAEHGLYMAEKTYFSSLILWAGPVPLPGGVTTIAALFLALSIKFFAFSPWRMDRAGTLLAHFGIWLLLFGGLLTALTGREGVMVIPKGARSDTVSAYHDRIFVVERGNETVFTLPQDEWRTGAIDAPDLPFPIKVLEICNHCDVTPIQTPDPAREGLAAQAALKTIPPERENELNRAGMTFSIQGKTYIAVEDVPGTAIINAQGQSYDFSVRRAAETLPFTLHLVDFQKALYPGTEEARAYHSDVIVEDGSVQWPARIEMNRPLRYKGYTFYQSSFVETQDGAKTVLSVPYNNTGRLFPYVSGALLAAGLVVHLLLRMRGMGALSILLAGVMVCTGPAHATSAPDPAFDYAAFERLPVLHAGRIKPMGSFAKSILHDLSNRTALSGLSAGAWLAQTLFDPAAAAMRPVLYVPDPESIGLPAKADPLYSHAEISTALEGKIPLLAALAEREAQTLTPDQRALARVYERFMLQADILRSLTLLLPQDGGENTPERMEILARAGALSTVFRIIPPETPNGEWLSPWSAVLSGERTQHVEDILNRWKAMATAWREGNVDSWKAASESALTTAPEEGRIGLENFYNRVPFFPIAIGFYGLAVLFVFLKVSPRYALGFLTAGAFFHATAITLRVLILSRPPVGTLYESILFVALLCAGAALAFAGGRANRTLIAAGGVSGAGLLLLSSSFAQGDNLDVLVAVLNTNFWLATHVLCVTAGYGFCILASLAAHAALIRRFMAPQAGGKTENAVLPLSLIALLFTSVGTLLGGLWADQSWGRFWGWDPKENGALLIVLWIIWMLHGRMGGQLQQTAFLAAAACLSIVVALAWFGVNLLGAGLHSYGFIDGAGTALFAFCAAEGTLIAGLWILSTRRKVA